MLSSEEYSDLFRVYRAKGYVYDDFEVSNLFFTKNDGRAYQFVSLVVIRHVRQNISRTYTAGYGSYWLIRFESDLQKGCFDMIVPPYVRCNPE